MSKARRISLFMVLVLFMSMSIQAFAATNSELTEEQIAWLKANVKVEKGKIVTTDLTIRSKLVLQRPDTASSDEYASEVLADGTTVYWKKSQDKSLGTAITRAFNTNQAKDKLSELENVMDTDADLQGAGVMLEGFKPIINLFMGIAVSALFAINMIHNALDCFYIGSPFFREGVDGAVASGGATVGGMKGASHKAGARWVTDEAKWAVEHSLERADGSTAWMPYFKKRTVAWGTMVITFFILLTGNIGLITNLALRIVSGIIRVIQSLSNGPE